MDLTIKQAADRMGKSIRQVRYLIEQGTISASKVEGRWVVQLDQLPLSAGREAAQARAMATLDTQVERVIEQTPTAAPARRYSVCDLKAFQIARPLYQQVQAHLGTEHDATLAALDLLQHLTRGCHRFAWPQKAIAYREARDAASQVVCLLLLEDEPSAAIASELEQELMPALGGLIRRVERKERR